MVEVMTTIWKGLLVPTPSTSPTSLPSPEDLRRKILVKVKYVDPKKAAAKLKAKTDGKPSLTHKESSISASSSGGSANESQADHAQKKKKKSAIVPLLSALGVYTRAIHFSSLKSPDATIPTHVFSLSEKKLMEVHESSGPTLFSHNRNFLMRAFPSGMRVRSDNLDPSVFWRKGVQMVALNWQKWDQGLMLNEAMFAGSGGWVLKPNGYRSNTSVPAGEIKGVGKDNQADAVRHKTLTLNIEILAAQDIPLPIGDARPEGFHPYIKCELHVEKSAERTGAPIEGGGKSKDGEYKQITKSYKGCEVDFGSEQVSFRGVSGVVEELSFLR